MKKPLVGSPLCFSSLVAPKSSPFGLYDRPRSDLELGQGLGDHRPENGVDRNGAGGHRVLCSNLSSRAELFINLPLHRNGQLQRTLLRHQSLRLFRPSPSRAARPRFVGHSFYYLLPQAPWPTFHGYADSSKLHSNFIVPPFFFFFSILQTDQNNAFWFWRVFCD